MEGLRPFADAVDWLVAAVQGSPGFEIATWFLALVFLWSGVVKLARPAPAAVAIARFRVLRNPRSLHGSLLGAFETALAVALVAGQAMPVVLGLTAALLAAFAALIARSLAAGERFPCMCFGQQDEGLSAWTLLRTAALGALAVLLLTAGAGSAARAPLDEETWFALVTAGAALMTLVTLGRAPRLARMNREVKAHFDALATGGTS